MYEPFCAVVNTQARRSPPTVVELERLQLVLVLLEVREAEVPERTSVARNTLNCDVVVLSFAEKSERLAPSSPTITSVK